MLTRVWKKANLYPLAFAIALPVQVNSQELTLTLEDALRIAERKSEQVEIAQAGVQRASAEQIRARAQLLPQLNGIVGYTRTLATEFSGLFDEPSGPICAPLMVDPEALLPDRVSELERFLLCGGPSQFGFGGADADRLPFGRKNIWQAGLSFAQAVYTGGRIRAQRRFADALRESAEIEVNSANAQFMLDVTQAFYDTSLSFALLQIAEANLAEATKTLEFVRLGHRVGRVPEFDVLRAEVTRRNQLPEIARRRAAVEQSGLRLRQLLELSPSTDLRIDADLLSPTLPVPAPFVVRFEDAQPLKTMFDRAPVQQADAVIRQREASLDAARAQRLPSISIGSDYGLVAYPTSFLPTSTNQFRNNWTAGFSVQVPLFQGGRIRADIASAEANLDEARSQRRLTRELAVLDTRIAVNQLRAAEEAWEASGGTVDQAMRAFEIARLRYSEGISNQLELDEARIALLESRANRAQAGRDLQVARATLALLPLLPLSPNLQTPGQPITPARNVPAVTSQPQAPNPFVSGRQVQPAARRDTSSAGARSLP